MNFKLARFQVFAVALALGIVPVVPATAAGTQDEAGMLAVILLKKMDCKALTGSIGSTSVNLERDSLLSTYDVSGNIGNSRVKVEFDSFLSNGDLIGTIGYNKVVVKFDAFLSTYDVSGYIGSSQVEVDFDSGFSNYDVSGYIGSSRVQVDLNSFLSADDASGSFGLGVGSVKLNCGEKPAGQGPGSTANTNTNSETSVCVKEKGKKEFCQQGTTWSYENCWQFSKKGPVMFQVKKGSNWKTLQNNVATKDVASCYKKHPWLVSVERTESSEGNKVYRIKFPSGFNEQIRVRRIN